MEEPVVARTVLGVVGRKFQIVKSLTLKMCVIAAALLLASPAVAVNSNGRGTKVKTVYQDTDPSATNYLKNRRALVGPGCTVNSVGAGVSVASGLKDLKNLCNDDLDDYATIPALVDATVAASPVVSIKDNKHYYAKGTEAGFTICTNSNAGILEVDVSTLYGIRFFKDGEAVSDVVAVKTGQNITGLGLSLLTIPGSSMVTKSFVAEAPADFDEVQLYRMGVKANVGALLNVKYAFVGKAREYTVTNNKENGIQNYVKDYNRKTITLSGDQKLYDEDLTNSVLNNIGSADVRATPTDGKEVFPAGTEIGFKYKVKDGLSLGLGVYTKITLYSKDYKTDLLGIKHDIQTESHTVNVGVLNLGVIKKDKEDAEVVIKLFYDVTTLYFEADYEDELRKTGFSKEGRHSNPQIILGLLVSLGGYPLAYCIHEGNKYEGHTMLPTINEFVSKYGLENFVVVADSGLMNNANIAELEAHGYKYIIGAKIKNESQEVKNWILEQPKRDCQMVEYDKGGGRRLLVGYTDDRAKKDAYNREKGIRRLEKAYKHGALTKGNINKRGYNKFLSMDGEVKVAINYDRVADDSKWDGLKGYLTNTDIPIQDVYTAYHNLWHVERAFRIAKSKVEIRPMFHFTRKRFEAHICICFVALKVYKELERMLKVSEIKMSVDKVLALAKTITAIQIKLPLNKEVYTQTMLMARHQKIAKLFDEDFWGTQ